MNKFKLAALFAGLLAGAASLATAQSMSDCGCTAFLADGLVLNKERTSTDQRDSAFFQFYCSAEESVAVDTFDRHRQLGLLIPDKLKLNLSGTDKRTSLREWRRAECNTVDRQVNEESLRRTIEQVANTDALNAANQCFSNCRATGGLFCSMSPVGATDAIFRARWVDSSTNNESRFPKITGGDLVGARFRTEGFARTAPITEGLEIPRTGISAALTRENVGRPITLRLQTDMGSCSPVLKPLDTALQVSVMISGQGQRSTAVTINSGHVQHGNSGSCTENNVRRDVPVCLGVGARVTSFTPRVTSSNNDGSLTVEMGNPTPDCAIVHYLYSDKGRRFGDCRGNGWIHGSADIIGTRPENWTAPSVTTERSATIPSGEESQVIIEYPQASLTGTSGMVWSYTLKIEEVTEADTRRTIELGSAAPNLGRFETSISPSGQVRLSIKPR